MRRIAVLDAPSNLGLRPPTVTSVPGCAKAPGALRDHGLLAKLDARDAGCLTPPRYDAGDWRPGDGVAMAPQIAAYSRALADRIGAILDAGEFPVVLGGDCSIVLGSGLAMHRLGEAVGGRIGLVFVDGHSDFRHPGNASYVGAAAGEDLALVTGRGQADLAAIEGRRPYFRDIDVVVMGIRAQDEYRLDLQAAGIVTRPVPALRAEGAARSAQWARDQLVDCAGYWVHVDVDVLDPAVMPAVDAPSPGGIAFPELEILLAGLVESPHCLGVEITVFDPDYDLDGAYAAEIVSAVTAGLAAAHTVTPRPDLIAARADLNRPEATQPAAAFNLLRRPATPDLGRPTGDTDSDFSDSSSSAELSDSGSDADLGEPGINADLDEPGSHADLGGPGGDADFSRPGSDAHLGRPGSGADFSGPGSDADLTGSNSGADFGGSGGGAGLRESAERVALSEPDADLSAAAPAGSEIEGPADTSSSADDDREVVAADQPQPASDDDARQPATDEDAATENLRREPVGGLNRPRLSDRLNGLDLAAGFKQPERAAGLNRPEPGGLNRSGSDGLGRSESGGLNRSESAGLGRSESGGLNRSGSARLGRPDSEGLDRSQLAGSSSSEAGDANRAERGGVGWPSPGALSRTEPGGPGRSEAGGRNRPGSGGVGWPPPADVGRTRPGGLNRSGSGGLNRSGAGGLNRSEAGGPSASEQDDSSQAETDGSRRPEVGGLNRSGSGGVLGRPESVAGLDRTGLAEGLKRSDLLGGLNRPEPVARLNRHLSAVTDDEPAERQEANGREAHEREWQRRRAAGAADSVSLAAAGMSDGVAEASEEVAIPASTLLGVEEAEALPAEQPGGTDAEFPQSDAQDDLPADENEQPNLAPNPDQVLTVDQDPDPLPAGEEETGEGRPGEVTGLSDEGALDAELSDEEGDGSARPMTRPLGRAPLLDSEPLPATRPGMLRPRMPDDKARMAEGKAHMADEKESFSLPVQRPAFELGSDEPADIA